MAREVDLESAFRTFIVANRASAIPGALPVSLRLNKENRVVAKFAINGRIYEFLVFGNNVRQYLDDY